ncbi:phosphotransferase [Siccirubricoccus sp. KC 17139]|uniref:Phosphotransferase n=1 Tax=Siccirubricoccus soli TaxID=2899147 RepID=A0ABT1D8U2_9PROT|nr:phosphotransferase [Siccirubricoccus soli]MCO6418007.1 phosphotransferase [Siccirubricoccus soli]MCP2684142.1 phosphotransferase [Siccirubricoccus soli]
MLTPPLGAAAIAGLVPHQGSMCLLDRALSWDAAEILCATDRHRDPANPLRRDGMLPAVCGLEFAFQAMALHGALNAGGAQRPGFVSSLREVALEAERLDDIPGELRIAATALMAEAGGFIYRFAITAGDRRLLHGQAAVILPREDAPA